MPTIRSLLLDGIALTACCAGLFSVADGYARSLPRPSERAAAQAWFDPDITTSITPKDEKASPGKRGRAVRATRPAEADAEPSKGRGDPSYRKRAW